MSFRSVPPVRSPLSATSIAAGVKAGFAGRKAREELRRILLVRYGARDVRLLDSGTSALAVAFRAIAARLEADASARPVALPAYCCYDVVTAAAAAGRPIVLYDVDPETLAPNLESLDRALRQAPLAVVAAHLYGVPVDVPALQDRVESAGAVLVEDAAQAAGAEIHGRSAGALASVSVLSFGRGKGTTGGGGGALLGHGDDGERLVGEVQVEGGSAAGWSNVASAAAQWVLGRPALYGLPRSLPVFGLGETVYRQPWPARPISASAAGILGRTLELADEERDRRRENAGTLRRALCDHPHLTLPGSLEASARPGWLRLPVLLAETARAELLRRAFHLGVEGGYPQPLHRLPAARERLIQSVADFPGATRLAREVVTLPTHGLLSARAMEALSVEAKRAAARLAGCGSPRRA